MGDEIAIEVDGDIVVPDDTDDSDNTWSESGLNE